MDDFIGQNGENKLTLKYGNRWMVCFKTRKKKSCTPRAAQRNARRSLGTLFAFGEAAGLFTLALRYDKINPGEPFLAEKFLGKGRLF